MLLRFLLVGQRIIAFLAGAVGVFIYREQINAGRYRGVGVMLLLIFLVGVELALLGNDTLFSTAVRFLVMFLRIVLIAWYVILAKK